MLLTAGRAAAILGVKPAGTRPQRFPRFAEPCRPSDDRTALVPEEWESSRSSHRSSPSAESTGDPFLLAVTFSNKTREAEEFLRGSRELNVRSNEQLDQLVGQAQRVIRGVEPRALREDTLLRQEVAFGPSSFVLSGFSHRAAILGGLAIVGAVGYKNRGA